MMIKHWVCMCVLLHSVSHAFFSPPEVISDSDLNYPSPETRQFQGIPSLAVSPGGRLWATWYAGPTPGEDKNNYVVLATSGDDGRTWREVMVLEPDGPGPVRAFDPEIWLDPQDRLWLFWAQHYAHDKFNPHAGVWAMVTDNPDVKDAQWSAPRRLTEGIMMCKPTVLSDGRWLLPTSTWRRTDYSARAVASDDDGRSFEVIGACNVLPVEDRTFDEHMIVERKDGSLWMLVRTRYGIGESVSTDGGRTWSELTPSLIEHPSSRFFITRIDSGNLLLVKHGPIDQRTGRSHLMAFVSKDDGKTWRGGLLLDEREGVSYPDGQQTSDGSIYITYDFSRTQAQEILMAVFTEADVLAGKPASEKVRLKVLINKTPDADNVGQIKKDPPRAIDPVRFLTVGEGFIDPLGFHDAVPVFSWQLPEGTKRQTAYRIEVKSEGLLWDSGWVESDQSVFVPYEGEPLMSRQKIEWRVRFRDEYRQDSGWSKSARFEMGLLSRQDWKAKWIQPKTPSDPEKESVACLVRRFRVDETVADARLYITARGLFDLHLNGLRVGNDYFANGWTSYHKRLDTLTYNITDLLQKGDNTMHVKLAKGWYAGRLGWQNQIGLYGKHPELLLQLEISYTDGSSKTVVSDEGWKAAWDGPIVSSSIYDGEHYDARRQAVDWGPVKANSDLGSAQLTPKPFAPVRIAEILDAKEITEPLPERFVFDLGQNIVGWARITIPVTKDQTVTVRFAEMLNKDGTLYTENYRSAKSINTYTAAQSGTIEWEPTFTFHGFRYVELSGLSKGVNPKKQWVTGVVLHTDMRKMGAFESSHAKLNQLQSNIVWGQRGNFIDIPTDCPQRDERMGWTGDAQVFCPTSMSNYDCHAFWKSWLGSMRDDQKPDGQVPDIVPDVLGRAGSPGWQDAAAIIPWEVYVRTGDTELLAQNFEMMEKLVGWYRSQSTGGLINQIKAYGDWLQPYAESNRGDTPAALIGTAFYAHSTQILADSARILNRGEDSKRYAAEADFVKQAFSKHYFDAEMKLKNAPETQTGYLLAIAFHLIAPDDREKASAHLVRLVHEADNHLRTGFLGTPYIVSVLDEMGYPDLAYELLFQETYPSWFFSIDQGATTMWERWNSYSHENGFGDAGMNSFNHYAYGAIGQWMYDRIAGLKPDPANPGYKHFFVRPLIGKQLDWANASIETPYGKASSRWNKKGSLLEMEVVVPPNTTATIEFPDGRKSRKVEAGRYTFVMKI